MTTHASKVIKPFYNVRLANRMQACANELNEKAKNFAEEQSNKTKSMMEGLVSSTFSTIKSKATRRREANQGKRRTFNETLSLMVATAAYNAMPVDGKVQLSEDAPISAQPEAFQKMLEVVSDYVTKDPSVSMKVGDMYARSSLTSIGSSTEIKASQMAIAIAGSVTPVREALSDNPDAASYTTQNFLDNLLTFGDTAEGETKQRGNITMNEQVYETFVQSLTENVEEKILYTMKVESEKAEMEGFLQEQYQEDKYSKHTNRNLARVAAAPSVFREMYKTCALQNAVKGFSQEQILAETIAQFSVMETLNSLEMLGKTNEQIIKECVDARRQIRY